MESGATGGQGTNQNERERGALAAEARGTGPAEEGGRSLVTHARKFRLDPEDP